ncbi:MAG: hypothetical protein WDZ59_15725 [Pirellulales bacterium]
MRLTLRTLLAYLDDILDPADHEELGRKIAESEFASALVHRTRDVVRRLRLGAPQLTGREMGLDPNTVAEYLDNTLPAERVADFERVCLESDVHLAEVASCHQILALVLGEPAEVDPETRARMYQLAAQPTAASDGLAVTAPPDEQPGFAGVTPSYQNGTTARTRRRPEVPDYLRASSRSRSRRLIAAALVLVVAVALAWAFVWPWPFGAQKLGQSDGPAPQAPDASAGAPSGTPDTTPGDAVQPQPNEFPQDELEPEQSAAVRPDQIEPAPPMGTESGDAEPGEAARADAALPVDPEQDPIIDPDVQLPEQGTPLVNPVEPQGDAPPEPDPLPSADVVPAVPDVGATAAADGAADIAPLAPSPGDIPTVDGDAADAAVPPTPDGNAEDMGDRVGVYSGSDKDVLLRYRTSEGQWYRVGPGEVIESGQTLLALPAFRPSVTLVSGAVLQMAGGTQVRIDLPEASGPPQVIIDYGRVVLLNAGRPGSQVALQLGDHTRRIDFGASPATVAIELKRPLLPGVDPASTSAPVEVNIVAVSGGFQWQNEQQTIEVEAPAQWSIPGGNPAPLMGELPEWVAGEQLSASDRLAWTALEDALALDRSANLSLSELVDRRRLEIRSLAARSSAHIGQFKPFIRALNDTDQRAVWPQHIETLREALALSPAVAAEVRQALQEERGTDGQTLYRMLWGYSREQVEQGALAQLIDYLEHDRLDMRVLAFWNLKELTGIRLNYYPYSTQLERQAAVQAWRRRLESGELVVQPTTYGQAASAEEAATESP